MQIFSKSNVYLDYASGAHMHSLVSLLVSKILNQKYYNPASIHSEGLKAKKVLENSRNILAKNINSHSDEIIFTGSGTESIAVAIVGVVMEARKNIKLPHVVTSTIEHSSVLETIKMLEDYSLITATYLKPNSFGIVNLEDLKKSITKDTVMVSMALVNGEIGTILNTEEILKLLSKIKEENYNLKSIHLTNNSYYPYLHLDSCQAVAHLNISHYIKKGVDLLSFNSVKIGGPSGIGLLFKKRSVRISKMYAGGDQEMGLRPGTQSPFLAAGFAKALEITKNNLIKNENKYIDLKKSLLKEIEKLNLDYNIDFVENSSEYSVPSIVNISFPYFSGQQMAIELDARGVIVSSKSACKSLDENESYVIGEIRKNNQNKTYNNYGSIRISFGPETKNKDIIKLTKALGEVLKTYKGVLY